MHPLAALCCCLVRSQPIGRVAAPTAFVSTFETKQYEPSHGPARFVTLFIPGNPGLVDFYGGFGKALADASQSRVVLVGFAGHLGRQRASRRDRHQTPFDLNAQLDHCFTLAQKIAADAALQKVPFVLVGHSIGAWIAIKVACRMGEDASRSKAAAASPPSDVSDAVERDATPQPAATLGLLPFLSNPHEDASFESKYRAMARYGAFIPAVAAAASLGARLLPRRVLRRLLSAQLEAMEPASEAVVFEQLLCFGALRNYLSLGRDEFEQLEPPFDWDHVLEPLDGAGGAQGVGASPRRLRGGGSLALLCSDADEWTSSRVISEAMQANARTHTHTHTHARTHARTHTHTHTHARTHTHTYYIHIGLGGIRKIKTVRYCFKIPRYN